MQQSIKKVIPIQIVNAIIIIIFTKICLSYKATINVNVKQTIKKTQYQKNGLRFLSRQYTTRYKKANSPCQKHCDKQKKGQKLAKVMKTQKKQRNLSKRNKDS